MNLKHERVLVIVGAILVIGLAIGLPFLSKPSGSLELNFALSQLAFSAVAFFIVFLTLYFTIIQLRKSMAKPRIKVVFNEKGEQQCILTIKNGGASGLPSPWLINEGNAISRYFQIDFIIPENIGKQSVYVNITKDKKDYVISNINDGRFTLFVNRPYQDPTMIISAGIDYKKFKEGNYIIKYKVYGDWAEIQEGELKIVCIKQEDLSNAKLTES